LARLRGSTYLPWLIVLAIVVLLLNGAQHPGQAGA
jgi:hypothetical protein